MTNGLYISAMGMQVEDYRYSVSANNLANAHTPGFKRAIAMAQARQNAAYEDPRMRQFQDDPVLSQIGGGVLMQPTLYDWGQGPLRKSESPTDFALDGQGFFTVKNGTGETYLTRNGKFMIASDGSLLTDGQLSVLDSAGQPIKVNPTLPIEVSRQGEVLQSGTKVSTLGLVTVDDPKGTGVQPIGGTLLRLANGVTAKPVDEGSNLRVMQNYTEESGVDSITEFVSMLQGQRAFEANAKMITLTDQMLGQLNTVGRVA